MHTHCCTLTATAHRLIDHFIATLSFSEDLSTLKGFSSDQGGCTGNGRPPFWTFEPRRFSQIGVEELGLVLFTALEKFLMFFLRQIQEKHNWNPLLGILAFTVMKSGFAFSRETCGFQSKLQIFPVCFM